jgi:hypothetical protein
VSQPARAFYTLDGELRLVGASPATFAVWGRPPGELIGRKLVEAFPWVKGGAVHEALEAALRSFRPVRLQTHSEVMGVLVDVEIYPVREGLQVSFSPARPG